MGSASVELLPHGARTITVAIYRSCGHKYAGSVLFNDDEAGRAMARQHGESLLTYTACNICARGWRDRKKEGKEAIKR